MAYALLTVSSNQRDWEDGQRRGVHGPLRSVVHEMTSMDNQDGCMGTRELSDGRAVLDVNTGGQLEFDLEACFFVLDDLPRLLRDYHDKPGTHPTHAYSYYASLGMMSMKSGMQGEVDEMLRRSNWKVRNGVAGQIDGRSLWDRAVSREAAGMAPTRGARVRGAAGSRSVAHTRLIGDAPVTNSAPTPVRADSSNNLVVWMQPVELDDEAAEENMPALRMAG